MFTNLQQLITSMPDEPTCRKYLEDQIWNGKPICPFCGHDRSYKLNDNRTYKCASNKCYKKFTITVGTVFEASNLPLSKWFIAVYFATAHKKGISSIQLSKNIGVTQRTAWFMLHRVREIMRLKSIKKLDNIVEIDECWVGGKVGNMSKKRRAALRTETNGTIQNKTMVVGMIERGGDLKLIAMGKENNSQVLQPLINDNVDTDAVLITDSSLAYEGLNMQYAGHETVNHSEDEYARDGSIYTNTIEGAFSHFKRMIIGTYHQVTPKHLSRYCDETMYRYNMRKMADPSRFTLAIQNPQGRLKYKHLIAGGKAWTKPAFSIPAGTYPKGTVLQVKGGEIIATFSNKMEAARAMKVNPVTIWRVLVGRKRTCRGFEWKYA